ncbi:MAG: hypothetical protein BJ554DRAFT_6420 [Olpidium bornovanus]|uniref:Uncharacterized protein n=1 Tax=Olpidium bornovanus TaxID=278681 RepID=A0A8H7ZXT1_9FUNG|nr:MAG: hypothetical protein BJ554DRAFT_6420 [Olpidium bornovanus]
MTFMVHCCVPFFEPVQDLCHHPVSVAGRGHCCLPPTAPPIFPEQAPLQTPIDCSEISVRHELAPAVTCRTEIVNRVPFEQAFPSSCIGSTTGATTASAEVEEKRGTKQEPTEVCRQRERRGGRDGQEDGMESGRAAEKASGETQFKGRSGVQNRARRGGSARRQVRSWSSLLS